MNIQAIKEALASIAQSIDVLRSMQAKLPTGKKQTEAAKLLTEAEGKLKEAEARIAHELGFPVCKRCWPPEIMVRRDDGEFVCRNCGKLMPDDIHPNRPIPDDDLSTW